MRVRHRGLNFLYPQVLFLFSTSYTTSITSLMEARRIIEAAAALAAQRAAVRDLPELNAHIWGEAVVAASHNLVFKRLAGTIEAALRVTFASPTHELTEPNLARSRPAGAAE